MEVDNVIISRGSLGFYYESVTFIVCVESSRRIQPNIKKQAEIELQVKYIPSKLRCYDM